MPNDSDLGLFEPLFANVPPEWRPWVVSAIFALLALAFFWNNLLKPLAEMGASVWRFVVAFWTWLIARLGPRIVEPAEDGPKPEPIPEERTIWEAHQVSAPAYPIALTSGGIPILTIANMKGGVGKTTLSANLAAYFSTRSDKPVLVIDFDYQGSLSEMLWKHSGRSGHDLRAHTLLMANLSPDQAQAHARNLSNGLENVELFPARYPLATIENNIMIDWAKGEYNDDVRYRLNKILRDRCIQERYSMIIIDCPPRITTGTINALCASTHLLIPTKLDAMSAEAAVYFLEQIQRMQDVLFPRLSVVGIVPTMTQESERLADFENIAAERISDVGKAKLRRSDLLMIQQRVPERVDIARPAGVGVAYLRKPSVRPIFDRLGKAIEERLQ